MPESSVLHYKKISTLETYSEPCQISKMQCFAKIVDGFYPLTIFLKHSFLDVWQGFEYASEKYISFPNKKKNIPHQPIFTFSKLIKETLEQVVKYVQS